MPRVDYRLTSNDDDGPHGGPLRHPFSPTPQSGEDLPYHIELWSEDKSSVEQLLAVTANSSVGYGAYYAATQDYPNRYITLRHKGNILSRWNGPGH